MMASGPALGTGIKGRGAKGRGTDAGEGVAGQTVIGQHKAIICFLNMCLNMLVFVVFLIQEL